MPVTLELSKVLDFLLEQTNIEEKHSYLASEVKVNGREVYVDDGTNPPLREATGTLKSWM